MSQDVASIDADEAPVAEAHPRAVSPTPIGDTVRSMIAVLATVLAVLGSVCAAIAPLGGVSAIPVFCAGTFVPGTALAQLARRPSAHRFGAISVIGALAVPILIGFTLLEARVWSGGAVAYWGLLAAAVSIHVHWLFRSPMLHAWPRKPKHAARRIGAYRGAGPTVAVAAFATAGTAICLTAAIAGAGMIPGPGGLVPSLPPVWIAGLVIVVGAAVAAVALSRSVGLALGLLVTTLTLSPVVAYSLPRYDWAQKHVGVVLLFLRLGHVDKGVDIYQSWPGFFAGVAWLCRVGQTHPVEQVARWWPAVIDLTDFALVSLLARAFGASGRRAYLGAALFFLANVVGQDYFSPQAAAYALDLAVAALVGRPTRSGDRLEPVEWSALILGGSAIAVSHQLTPVALFGALSILVVVGYVRSPLAPLVVALPAVVWDVLHAREVVTYGSLGKFGAVASNIALPTPAKGAHPLLAVHLTTVGQAAGTLTLGLLALTAVLLVRTRLVVGLACAASSTLGFLVLHYGQEDLYRMTLFALPWLAALSAVAFGSPRYGSLSGRLRALSVAGLLPLSVTFWILATTTLDNVYVVRTGDLAVARVAQETPAGSTLISIAAPAYTPILSSERYPLHRYRLFGLTGKGIRDGASVRSLTEEARNIIDYERRHDVRAAGVYAYALQQAASQWITDGVLRRGDYGRFERSLLSSGNWSVVSHSSTAVLLRYVGKAGGQ